MKLINIALTIVLICASTSLAGDVLILKKSTAITIPIETLYSKSDHTTLATSIDAEEWTCTLTKWVTASSLTITASGGNNDAVYVTPGLASLELTTGNTDTLGRMTLIITDPNCDIVTIRCDVVDPNYYAFRYTTGEIDVYSWGGVKVNAADANGLPSVNIADSSQAWNATLATTADMVSLAQFKSALDETVPADFNTVTVADGKIAATATVDSSGFATSLLDTVIWGHKVRDYIYQLGVAIGRNGKGWSTPPADD